MRNVTSNATTVNDFTGLSVNGRYVRIYATSRVTTYGYSIYELEVYGTTSVTQAPYGGTRATIPGTIQAENYDLGGEGVAYHDLTPTNMGGQFRTTEAVDLESCNEGGYDLGYTQNGEWYEYSVNVTTPGVYTLQARVSTNAAGKSFHVELDGQTIGTIAVPNTGDWQTWNTVSITTPSLTAGNKVLRIVVDNAEFNLNWISFTAQSSGDTGTGNLALNKPVRVSSVEEAGFEAYKAVDGNATSSRWSSGYTNNEWIYVDLGSAQSINKVVLKWENAYATSYRIETSTDSINWVAQQTIAGVGGTETINFAAVTARYVKVQGLTRATPYGYSIWEFEVYGASLQAMKQAASMVSNNNLSIKNSATEFSVAVRPNPASNVMTVQTKGETVPGILKVYSISGQLMHQSRVSGQAGQQQIDISKWPKGIYVITIGESRTKVVVQ